MDFDQAAKRRAREREHRAQRLKKEKEARLNDAESANLRTNAALLAREEEKRKNTVMQNIFSLQGNSRNENIWKSDLIVEFSTRLDKNSNKLNLPPSALVSLSSSEDVIFPMQFAVRSKRDAIEMHCGVLEFSAEEGKVAVPELVTQNLGVGAGDTVEIAYTKLPPCEFLRLKAVDQSYLNLSNLRPVLEAKLRESFSALTRGVRIVVNGVPLQVTEIYPGPGASLIDTDVVIDLETPQQIDGEDEHGVRSIHMTESPLVLGIEAKNPNMCRIVLDGKILQLLNSGKILKISVLPQTFSLFVSAPPLTEASPHRFHIRSDEFGSMIVARKDLVQAGVFSQSGDGSWPSMLFVGICLEEISPEGLTGKVGSSSPSLEVQLKVEVQNEVPKLKENAPSSYDDSMTKCENCVRPIPQGSLELHQLRCAQLNQRCPECDLVLSKAHFSDHTHCSECGEATSVQLLERHKKIWHERKACPLCHKGSWDRRKLEKHQVEECPERLVLCRFCGIHVRAGEEGEVADARDRMMGLNPHEAACGNRTDTCSLCHRRVKLKDLDLHVKAVHTSSS